MQAIAASSSEPGLQLADSCSCSNFPLQLWSHCSHAMQPESSACESHALCGARRRCMRRRCGTHSSASWSALCSRTYWRICVLLALQRKLTGWTPSCTIVPQWASVFSLLGLARPIQVRDLILHSFHTELYWAVLPCCCSDLCCMDAKRLRHAQANQAMLAQLCDAVSQLGTCSTANTASTGQCHQLLGMHEPVIGFGLPSQP